MTKQRYSKHVGILALIFFLIFLPVFIQSEYWVHVLIMILIMALMSECARIFNLNGECMLGTAGFMLLGSYSSALLAIHFGLSFWVVLPISGFFTALIGFLLGIPFLRVRSVYFCILTLMTSNIFLYITGYWTSLTGGWDGLRDIPVPSPIRLWSTTLTFEDGGSYYYLTLAIVGISLVFLYFLEKGRGGMVWEAIKESCDLSEAVGINVHAQKLFVFSVICFFIGIAGALFAFNVRTLSPSTNSGSIFSMSTSMYVMLYAIIGGKWSFWGPLVGTALMMMVPELARPLLEWRPLLNGVLLIAIYFFMPNGIIGFGKTVKRLSKRSDDPNAKYKS